MKPVQGAVAALVFGTAAILLGIGACKGVPTVGGSRTVLTLYSNPAAVEVGGRAAITLSAFQTSGQPMPDGTQISFSVDRGSIEPATAGTVGGFAYATFSGDSTPGTARIVASSGSASSASLTVVVGSGAATLTLSASPSAIRAGGGSAVITALALDAGGAPAAGIVIVFETDKGTMASAGQPIRTGSNGVATDTLTTTLDATVTAKAYLSTTITTGGGGPPPTSSPVASPVPTAVPSPTSTTTTTVTASATLKVDVAGVGASALTITSDPASLGAGGGSATLSARAVDTNGNPVVGLAVVFTTSSGTLSRLGPVYTDAAGIATNTLTLTKFATVTVSAAGVTSASTSIAVGNPTPSFLSISLVSSVSSIVKPYTPPTPVAACSRLNSVYDVTLTATVTANGSPVPDALVTFYAQPLGTNARVMGSFCESPPQGTTDANGVVVVHWGMTAGELKACDEIALPCAGAQCSSAPCPTPVTTPVPGAINDCCCGISFTAAIGSVRDSAGLRILSETDCLLIPAGVKPCRCTF